MMENIESLNRSIKSQIMPIIGQRKLPSRESSVEASRSISEAVDSSEMSEVNNRAEHLRETMESRNSEANGTVTKERRNIRRKSLRFQSSKILLAPLKKRKKVRPISISESQDRDFIEVSWNNLTCIIKNRNLLSYCKRSNVPDGYKVILNNLNGSFRSGQMTAIMGPSGAGKSTLLDCISGKRTSGVSGDILISGCDTLKIGFVEQEDHLLSHITLKESLIFASRVKNSKKSKINHKEVAQQLIEKLGLENCANTYAHMCSGGQRKRLSIALELVTKIDILIQDEPTTGLDSSSCRQTIEAMKSLTQQGEPMAVVATIHQPSATVFNMFNYLYVLSNNGHCIYQGPPSGVTQALSRVGLNCPQFHNIADFVIEVSAAEFGQKNQKMLSHYANDDPRRNSNVNTNNESLVKLVKKSKSQYSHSTITHITLLIRRNVIVMIREPQLTITRFVSVIFTAILISLIFSHDTGHASGCPPSKAMLYTVNTNELINNFEKSRVNLQENLALSFITLMITVFNSLTPALLKFPLEMNVFRKEYKNNYYSIFSYTIAKDLSEIPFQIIPNTIYILIVNYSTGQLNEHSWRIEYIIGINFLMALVGQSHGMMFGALFMENPMAAAFAGGVSMLPLMLFGGFFKKIAFLPYYLIPFAWISHIRYALSATLISIFGLGRCQYEYQLFESSLNASSIQRPEWLETLTLLLEQHSPGLTNSPDPDAALMTVFGGKSAIVPENSTISMLLSHLEITDSEDYLWFNVKILFLFIFIIRFITSLILLHKVKH